MKNVLEWLEHSAQEHCDKNIYNDIETSVTFGEVENLAKRIGTGLEKRLQTKAPVAVFMDRQAKTPIGFLGVVYSGRAYAPIDAKLPQQRIEKIIDRLQPEVILTEESFREAVKAYAGDREVLIYEDLIQEEVDDALLAEIREQMNVTDPLYLIFTSGSSGNPKGVMTSHEALMTYINAYAGVMGIEESDRIGNQSPLDYIAAIRDIYLPMKTGCQTFIIPKEYFMEPEKLFGFMNEKEISSVGWSVSAFTIASSLGAFEETKLTTLRKVCFSGSVMPCKCLRSWQENLPETKFVNQYGPTEATASCTYYEVDHLVEEDEVLPIGKAYEGYHVFLLKEDNTEAGVNEEGEICVTGPALAICYYHDPERTELAFTTNPLDNETRMYRTGDIGLMREDGVLEFHGRRDRQIKHMGHRVELDEVECAASQVDGVHESCCIYVKAKEKLILFYTGEVEKKEVILELRKILPGFMVPRTVKKVEAIKKLPNGKIDYTKMMEEI